MLARIGEIASAVYAAEATTLRVAASLQAVVGGPSARITDDVAAAVEEAEIESAAAQVVVTELVLKATSDLFDTLGASATARTRRAGPALAQRPHRLLAQSADPQVAGRGRARRERDAAAVRVVDRWHPPLAGLAGTAG